MDYEQLTEENERRRVKWDGPGAADPLSGRYCSGERVEWNIKGTRFWFPAQLTDPLSLTPQELEEERLRCDFEYWCLRCVTIKDKVTGRDMAFRLNAPQRRVASVLEADRAAGRPLRLIMLKARQWGGSTLVQVYMAWIQICHARNWNSVICAHVKDTAATIRGMYSKLLNNYPAAAWHEEDKPEFRPYERSTNIRIIAGRGCRVTIGSAENQDSVRGSDIAMAHLSEVAFWKDTPSSTPESFIRAVCGSINYAPLTLIVLESTANGVGNYFHREWLRSLKGESDKHAVFVPWYEIPIYRLPVSDPMEVWQQMDDYERGLWESGLTLEMIHWFSRKRREYPSLKMMLAEYPTTDVEAFATTDQNVFAPEDVERLRSDCRTATARGEVYGDAPAGPGSLDNLRFVPTADGLLSVWEQPKSGGDYVVAVDVGGRSAKSDWSVMVVIDFSRARPEVVAEWRGHIDHDLLAWGGCRLARYYNDALLVFESNTLESEATDGDPSLFILNEVGDCYCNLYRRPSAEGSGMRVGFHTNRSTKTMIINRLIALVREQGYCERASGALDELLTYRQTRSGVYAAQPGCHDDRLMARAIALHVGMAEKRRDTADRSVTPYLGWFR